MGFFQELKNALNPDAAMRKQGRMTAPDGKVMVTDGPFEIATAEGRLLCKNCGVQFDSATALMVNAFYLGVDHSKEMDKGKRENCAIPCRKCDVYSVFLLSDVRKWSPGWGATRQAWVWGDTPQGIKYLHAGPLPIYDKQQRMLCRFCGVPFDEAAFNRSREGHKKDWTTTPFYFIGCSNCGKVCSFKTKELRRRPT